MKTRLEYRREKTDKIISDKFSCTYMNNTKWVKLLDALIENHQLISQILLKLVWDENIRILYIDETTSKDFDYYPKAMEGLISGAPIGWYDYKEIEWVEFSEMALELESLLNTIGKFEYEILQDKLKLFCYK